MDIDICGPSVAKMLGIPQTSVYQDETGTIAPIAVNENLSAMSIAFMMDNQSEAIVWRGPRKVGLIQVVRAMYEC